jgi:hypothetical protein
MAGPKTEPQVKGVALRTIDLCFREMRGPEHYQKALSLMDPELAHTCRTLILATAWYPISWYKGAFKAYRAATGEGTELPRLIGMACVRHDMQAVYKQLMLKIVSPQVLLTMAQRVFGAYYDHGALSVIEARKGYGRMQCTSCLGWDENMWAELVGSCEMQLELAGAKHVRIRVISGTKNGDVNSELEAHWI